MTIDGKITITAERALCLASEIKRLCEEKPEAKEVEIVKEGELLRLSVSMQAQMTLE